MKENISYKLIHVLKIPFQYACLESALILAQKILDNILPLVNIYVTAEFINTCMKIYHNECKAESLIKPLLFVLLIVAYQLVASNLFTITYVRLKSHIRETYRVSFIKKVAALDYEYIESEHAWDLITRMLNRLEERISEIYVDSLDLLTLLIRVIGLLVIISAKVWWIGMAIVVVCVPLFRLSMKGGKECYDVIRQTQKYNRKVSYLKTVLSGGETKEERSLFSYSDKVGKQLLWNYEKSRKLIFKLNVSWQMQSKIGSIITSTTCMLILLVMLFPLKNGAITLGMFIAIIENAFGLINILSWKIPTYGNVLARNREYIKDLNEFFNMKGTSENLSIPSNKSYEVHSLEFKNVSFRYPGTDKWILRNVSFCMKEGENYAFVGDNGAGKSTIIKLIAGLYEDYKGQILINGRELRQIEKKVRKAMLSIVYQDFARYHISIKDNILVGSRHRDIEEERIKLVLEDVGMKAYVDSLSKGWNTNLGKLEEQGTELSGGQWQKLALARLLYSNSSLNILDEPTAALDPAIENDIYTNFRQICKGNMTIIISHRLAVTKCVDKILVLQEGIIKEEGTFDELMKMQGIYYSMYQKQGSWYQNEKEAETRKSIAVG